MAQSTRDYAVDSVDRPMLAAVKPPVGPVAKIGVTAFIGPQGYHPDVAGRDYQPIDSLRRVSRSSR